MSQQKNLYIAYIFHYVLKTLVDDKEISLLLGDEKFQILNSRIKFRTYLLCSNVYIDAGLLSITRSFG